MKATVKRSEIASAYKLASTATGNIKKHHQFLHIESFNGKMTFTGNIDHYAVSSIIECEGDDFEVCVDASKIGRAVNAAKTDTISIEINDDKAIIKYGKSRLTVQTIPTSQYVMPDFTQSYDQVVRSESIVAPILSVSHAMGSNDVRQFLNGMHFDKSGYVVATNGHRLAYSDIGLNVENEVILPRESLIKISKLIQSVESVSFSVEKSRVILKSENLMIAANVIDGKFPEWKSVIFEKDMEFDVDYTDLLSAVDTAIIAASVSGGGRMTGGNGSLKIETKSSGESAETEIDCDCPEFDMGVNLQYLSDAIKAAGDFVKIGVTHGKGIIVSNNSGFAEVIMEMRV